VHCFAEARSDVTEFDKFKFLKETPCWQGDQDSACSNVAEGHVYLLKSRIFPASTLPVPYALVFCLAYISTALPLPQP
jgi:hypothetical protein